MLRELLGATIKLLAMLLLGYYIERAHAGDYFCFPHGTRLIDISSSTSIGFSDNRVVPKTDQAIQELNKNLSCHWIFHFNLNRDELILVLSGFNVGKAEFYRQRLGRSAELTGVQPPRMRYRLDAPAESKCSLNESRGWKTVDETTLEIVQISSRSKLSIEFDQATGSQHDLQGLRIQLMEPQTCGRDVVYFDGNCYMIAPVRRSLIDQLAVINRESRVAQLASFNSSITMRQFLAQSQRDRIGSGFDVHSKVPMNLKQPARIGLFYDGGNKSIYYLGRSSSDLCEMNLLTDAHKLFYTVESADNRVFCGSLRTAAAVGLIEFRNCSESLPALISFPDDGGKTSCFNCSSTLLNSIRALDLSPTDVPDQNKSLKPNGAVDKNMLIAIAIAILAFLFVAVSVIVLCKLWAKRRTEEPRYGDNSPDQGLPLNVQPDSMRTADGDDCYARGESEIYDVIQYLSADKIAQSTYRAEHELTGNDSANRTTSFTDGYCTYENDSA
ncbi:hypothetical protein BOX15_Mlig022098g1 [Macrostomum lignano]|uniref:CUB domain-containing protein n=1 Tax=Macrostomum lignano TaxID=282301 RepID=A0A267G815_9PLAT|nr:hypothetical protein BOX15_Mlig022098g1 [Macrostomum lignano]